MSSRSVAGGLTREPNGSGHQVAPSALGFVVLSARSGNRYVVVPTGGDEATCTCPAGEHGRPCSHVSAVREYAAAQDALVTNLIATAQAQATIAAEQPAALEALRTETGWFSHRDLREDDDQGPRVMGAAARELLIPDPLQANKVRCPRVTRLLADLAAASQDIDAGSMDRYADRFRELYIEAKPLLDFLELGIEIAEADEQAIRDRVLRPAVRS